MPRLVVIGLAAGLFSALFGVGGGIVIVPLLGLLLASRFDERAATGTSLAAIGVIALAGTIAYAVFGKLDVGAAALVACLSGRAGEDAERIVGVSGVRYVGNHGLELDPEAARWRDHLREFAATVDWPVEDKGLTVSFHYRLADDLATRGYLEGVAAEAREAGLDARFGRKVLELRPPLAADKGTAVARLLQERGLARALYAGDDTTDLDAFRGLETADLEVAVRIAVMSDEAPEGLARQADLVVAGPDGMLELLRAL